MLPSVCVTSAQVITFYFPSKYSIQQTRLDGGVYCVLCGLCGGDKGTESRALLPAVTFMRDKFSTPAAELLKVFSQNEIPGLHSDIERGTLSCFSSYLFILSSQPLQICIHPSICPESTYMRQYGVNILVLEQTSCQHICLFSLNCFSLFSMACNSSNSIESPTFSHSHTTSLLFLEAKADKRGDAVLSVHACAYA